MPTYQPRLSAAVAHDHVAELLRQPATSRAAAQVPDLSRARHAPATHLVSGPTLTALAEQPMALPADLSDHLRVEHGCDPLDLLARHDRLTDLHHFEHIEAECGLTAVDHRH